MDKTRFKWILISCISLAVLALTVLILNYFNTFSLSLLFPKQLGWLPHRPVSKPSVITNQLSQSTWEINPLVQRAKEIGYNIIWMGPDDITGRTVFYEDRKDSGSNGLGLKEQQSPNGQKFFPQIIGSLQELKDIPKSKDKYLVLFDPITTKELSKVRLQMDPSKASTASGNIPTRIVVEDLTIQSSYDLGQLGTFSPSDIEKLLKRNDALVTQLFIRETGNVQDENGNFIALFFYIRRFGGKVELEKELGRSL